MSDFSEDTRPDDAMAAEEVYRVARQMARGICRGGGPPGAPDLDWEDVAQEACRKLHAKGFAQFRGTGSERSYIYSIVKTTVIDLARSANRRQERETVVSSMPRPAAPAPQTRVDVRQLLDSIDSACRDLIVRLFFRDQTYAEVARELGLAESSVRAKLSRCLKRARRIANEGGSS